MGVGGRVFGPRGGNKQSFLGSVCGHASTDIHWGSESLSHTVDAVEAAGHGVRRMFWVRDTSVCLASYSVIHFHYTTHTHRHMLEKEANSYVPSGGRTLPGCLVL